MDDLGNRAEQAAILIKDRLPAVVLTGAGMSVESNIPPFRGPGGLWEKYDPMEYGHIDTLSTDPEKAWILLNDIISTSAGAEPNIAHRLLAEMEDRGWVGPVITQNVDGLHLAAGSRDVLEIHGNVRKIFCMKCGKREDLAPEMWNEFSPRCGCGGWKRPDIVFFGEGLPDDVFGRSVRAASSTGAMIVIGTSGIVYPAAALPMETKRAGGVIIEINSRPSQYTSTITDIFLNAPATSGVARLEAALSRILSD
ncbi:MAG: SIR2 family NAD-dependent protein deacylase [Thermoplasmatota archaeon]